MEKENNTAKLLLLPPREGTCPECAVAHDPKQPHNRDSLYYQYHFYAEHGRWPTWNDAMAHCDPAVQLILTIELANRGIKVTDESTK